MDGGGKATCSVRCSSELGTNVFYLSRLFHFFEQGGIPGESLAWTLFGPNEGWALGSLLGGVVVEICSFSAWECSCL